MPVELVVEDQRVLHYLDELLVEQQLRQQVFHFVWVGRLFEVFELVLALLFVPVLVSREVDPQGEVFGRVERFEDFFDDLEGLGHGFELGDVGAVQVVLDQVCVSQRSPLPPLPFAMTVSVSV